MIGKKDIEMLRLKTRLAECKQVFETSPYASQKEVAKNTLDSLQEDFKTLTGDYASDYLIKEESNETTFPLSPNRIFNVLSGSTFEKWFEKDFADFIEGDEKAKDKAAILEDIKNLFK